MEKWSHRKHVLRLKVLLLANYVRDNLWCQMSDQGKCIFELQIGIWFYEME